MSYSVGLYSIQQVKLIVRINVVAKMDFLGMKIWKYVHQYASQMILQQAICCLMASVNAQTVVSGMIQDFVLHYVMVEVNQESLILKKGIVFAALDIHGMIKIWPAN